MRRSAEWMVLCDERILEYLSENESGTPSEMANSGRVRWTRSYISQRAKKLVDHGLLKHLGNGVYIITDEGEAYLDEEYDAERGAYLDRNVADADSDGAESAGEANGT
ncbi:homolog to phage PhiH1 repressor protein [Natronomonas pharaonis DSM 2160]|uniref:Homolog to phage PhiH1 repressor protein n=1 Tax=Natronomonas pharaonis (strain ATCC 35678 / DSM 2160 / CIP 103997 / JCM 8858 / NBRC 14720 / NCIMB 2260 / Gabara) TaxID=348780 RepID=A0A1U7EW27_NATPD|nr:PhiH1 repressor [Natronomonas pharaonis]CAI49273.1 homolog to phage PhiH1 repressor protein [Natronomonas pharaonis DSM 2160]